MSDMHCENRRCLPAADLLLQLGVEQGGQLWQRAEQRFRNGRLEEARAAITECLAVLERAPAEASPHQLLRARCSAGELSLYAADFDAADGCAAVMLAGASAAGDALRTEALDLWARSLMRRGAPLSAESEQVILTALQSRPLEATAADPLQHAFGCRLHALAARFRGNVLDSYRHGKAAVESFDQAGPAAPALAVAEVLDLVARACITLEKKDEAEAAAQRATALRASCLCEGHFLMAESLVTHGLLSFMEGDLPCVIDTLRSARTIFMAELAEHHPSRSFCDAVYAAALVAGAGDVPPARTAVYTDEAEEVLLSALAVQSRGGRNGVLRGMLLMNLGELYWLRAKSAPESTLRERGYQCHKQAIEHMRGAYGENHIVAGVAARHMAMEYAQEKCWAESAPAFAMASGIYRNSCGEESDQWRGLARLAGETYQQAGDAAAAARWLELTE